MPTPTLNPTRTIAKDALAGRRTSSTSTSSKASLLTLGVLTLGGLAWLTGGDGSLAGEAHEPTLDERWDAVWPALPKEVQDHFSSFVLSGRAPDTLVFKNGTLTHSDHPLWTEVLEHLEWCVAKASTPGVPASVFGESFWNTQKDMLTFIFKRHGVELPGSNVTHCELTTDASGNPVINTLPTPAPEPLKPATDAIIEARAAEYTARMKRSYEDLQEAKASHQQRMAQLETMTQKAAQLSEKRTELIAEFKTLIGEQPKTSLPKQPSPSN